MTNIIAAPSLIPDALPAVTVPSFLKAGLNRLNFSTDTFSRTPSSLVTTIGSPLR
ncbi:Uncharacterised protein [Staphylococcus aureus]|nr:Uncharacterised protein [Staphylococcus aureus]CAC7087246.1 Uncharacterised protein [Staphylococcus aureus]